VSDRPMTLARARALRDESTPGPWRAEPDPDGTWRVAHPAGVVLGQGHRDDATFVAGAAALVDGWHAAETTLAHVRAQRRLAHGALGRCRMAAERARVALLRGVGPEEAAEVAEALMRELIETSDASLGLDPIDADEREKQEAWRQNVRAALFGRGGGDAR